MWRVSDTVPDVVNADAPVGRQDLPLAGHLLGPLLHAELLPKAVGDAVASDLVALTEMIIILALALLSFLKSRHFWFYWPVDILDVAVVSPLVAYVECGGDGTPVGVPSDRRLKLSRFDFSRTLTMFLVTWKMDS